MFFFHSRPLGRILECQWILQPYGTINFCTCYCHECERVKNSFQFCTILECWLHWNLKFIHSPQMDRGDCLRTLGKMWEAFMLFLFILAHERELLRTLGFFLWFIWLQLALNAKLFLIHSAHFYIFFLLFCCSFIRKVFVGRNSSIKTSKWRDCWIDFHSFRWNFPPKEFTTILRRLHGKLFSF